jgi:hypothetical protein
MLVGDNVDVATSPAVISRGRAMRFELLTVKGDTTIAASGSAEVQHLRIQSRGNARKISTLYAVALLNVVT